MATKEKEASAVNATETKMSEISSDVKTKLGSEAKAGSQIKMDAAVKSNTSVSVSTVKH